MYRHLQYYFVNSQQVLASPFPIHSQAQKEEKQTRIKVITSTDFTRNIIQGAFISTTKAAFRIINRAREIFRWDNTLFLFKQHYSFIIWLSRQLKTIKPITVAGSCSLLMCSSNWQLLILISSFLGLLRGHLLGLTLLSLFPPHILFTWLSFFMSPIQLTMHIQRFGLPSRTAKRYTWWDILTVSRSRLSYLIITQCLFIALEIHWFTNWRHSFTFLCLNLLQFWVNFPFISISLCMQPILTSVTWIRASSSSFATWFPCMSLVEISYKL